MNADKQPQVKRFTQPHVTLRGQGKAVDDVSLAYVKPVTPTVRVIRVLIVLAITVAVCGFLDRTGQFGFDWLEQDAYNARMLWHTQRHPVRKGEQEVVLVTISDETFAALGLTGPPMPRDRHAQVIRELIKAGASAVAFDLVFDVARGEDKELAAAARESGGKVVWAGLFDNTHQFVEPTGELLSASPQLGHINVPRDASRPAVDRIQAFDTANGKQVAAFSLRAAMIKLGINADVPPQRVLGGWQVGKLFVPVDSRGTADERGSFQITYLGQRDAAFERIPYEDLYKFKPSVFEKAPSSDGPYDFKGKIVLIGDTSKVGNDTQYTPVGIMPGVEMHAHAIATLLRGSFVRPAPVSINFALLGAMAGVVCLLALARRVQRIVIWCAMIFTGYLLFTFWIFEQGIALHVVGPSAALVIATLGVLIERGMTEEHEKERMFDTLVTAAASAIEVRDPSTSGHSRRVTALTVGLARAVSESNVGDLKKVRFSAAQLRELRYATMLHDFGKIGVRENILTKSHKLEPLHFRVVKNRLLRLRDQREREFLQRTIAVLLEEQREKALAKLPHIEEERQAQLKELDEDLNLLERANDPSVKYLTDPEYETLIGVLDHLSTLSYRDEFGAVTPLLTDDERDALSIRRGSLTDDEYRQIQHHASMSYDFLRQIPWTSELSHIPDIAYCHHEKLNGAGYPRGISASEIPIQARIMTIADVYDALTASDRAYKRALTPEQALNILRHEALDGEIDQELLEIFVERQIYTLTAEVIGQVDVNQPLAGAANPEPIVSVPAPSPRPIAES